MSNTRPIPHVSTTRIDAATRQRWLREYNCTIGPNALVPIYRTGLRTLGRAARTPFKLSTIQLMQVRRRQLRQEDAGGVDPLRFKAQGEYGGSYRTSNWGGLGLGLLTHHLQLVQAQPQLDRDTFSTDPAWGRKPQSQHQECLFDLCQSIQTHGWDAPNQRGTCRDGTRVRYHR